MKKGKKTRGQLISELAKLRQRIAELEKSEAEHKLKEQTLRESKELFEKTFVTQLDALFILDANNPPKILDCNPSTTRVFGHSRKEMLGRTTDFLHVDKRSRRKFQENLYPTIAKQGFFHLPEFGMKRNDGTVFPTEHTVVSLEDDQGKRIGWVSVVRDISERKRAEEALRESEKELREQTKALEEANIALRVLLSHRDEEKKRLEDAILGSLQKLITPYLQRLKETTLSTEQQAFVDILEANLYEVTSPFTDKLSSKCPGITPRELEIAGLIKAGKTNVEIADLLGITENAVSFHRKNLRSKLGLKHKKVNLRSHLLSHV